MSPLLRTRFPSSPPKVTRMKCPVCVRAEKRDAHQAGQEELRRHTMRRAHLQQEQQGQWALSRTVGHGARAQPEQLTSSQLTEKAACPRACLPACVLNRRSTRLEVSCSTPVATSRVGVTSRRLVSTMSGVGRLQPGAKGSLGVRALDVGSPLRAKELT